VTTNRSPNLPPEPMGTAGPGAGAPLRTLELLNVYKRILAVQYGGAIVLVMLLGVALLVAWKWAYPPPLHFLIFLCGVMGALFSSLTRLYTFEELPSSQILQTAAHLNGGYLFAYSFTPPVVGGIAAIILYFAFEGGLLRGALFPEFICKNSECKRLGEVIYDYVPSNSTDYAKAIFWGFMAGFSERLVPNILLTIAQRTNSAGHDS
jgi:hypothetical protein